LFIAVTVNEAFLKIITVNPWYYQQENYSETAEQIKGLQQRNTRHRRRPTNVISRRKLHEKREISAFTTYKSKRILLQVVCAPRCIKTHSG
jgi:hypothetical protein